MRGQLVYAMERLSTPVELHANACRSQEIGRRKMRGHAGACHEKGFRCLAEMYAMRVAAKELGATKCTDMPTRAAKKAFDVPKEQYMSACRHAKEVRKRKRLKMRNLPARRPWSAIETCSVFCVPAQDRNGASGPYKETGGGEVCARSRNLHWGCSLCARWRWFWFSFA